MTLTQLKYILAVDRCRNFAQAARECFVTQPTLSMQVQKLEDYLQVTVFDRSNNPVKPTAQGKKVLEMAREVIHRSDALEEMARSLRQEVAGDYHLAIIPTLAPYVLPLFLEHFRRHWPKVRLNLYERQTDHIITLLKEDKLDAALLAFPLGEKTLHEEPVFWEPFHLLFSPGHPLLAKKEVREQDLRLEEAWLLEEGHCLRAQALQLCRPASAKVESGVFFEAGSIETLTNLVRTTQGFTIVPELAVKHLSKDDLSRLRPFQGKRPLREVGLVTGPFSLKHAITKALKESLEASLPKELLTRPKQGRVLGP